MRSAVPSMAAVAVLLFSAAAAWAQPEPVIPSLSTDQVARLNAGEILVEVTGGQDRPIADTIGVVDGPADLILAIIADFDSYTEFWPDTEEASVLRVEGEYTYCEGVTDTPWPMADREWVVRARSGPRTIDGLEVLWSDWKYVPDSGNLADTEGYWLLVPWGDDGSKTLVRYYLIADIGTWIPDFLMNWATENMLPETIEALRQRVVALQSQ